MPRWGWTLAASLVAACQSVPGTSAPVSGSFGGQHIGLVLGPEGGRLEYDCAAGTIDEPLILDRDGQFRARGIHSPGEGGPARIDHVPPALPALYEGRVRGDRMSLIVRVPSAGTVLGPVTLRRGTEPMLTRCL